MSNEAEAFKKLYGIIVRLRGKDGCPWDIEQTPLSLRDDLIEETYECIEAIDKQDPSHIKEELGDVLLLVTMIAYMHEQSALFSVSDMVDGLSEKLVRRHPHVFGKTQGAEAEALRNLSPEEALRNWARIKVEQEGRKPKDSILDGVSRGLPPLDRAWKLQKKAAGVGFDWPDTAGVIGKIKEELAEVEAAIEASVKSGKKENESPENELGDLLFSVVNLCRFMDLEPSIALQRTNIKFTERFRYVEKLMKENKTQMTAQNLAVMDQYWNEAKSKEA